MIKNGNMIAAQFCLSVAFVFLAVNILSSFGANGEQIPAPLQSTESVSKIPRVCRSDDPCFFGYVKVDQDSTLTTYRGLHTW